MKKSFLYFLLNLHQFKGLKYFVFQILLLIPLLSYGSIITVGTNGENYPTIQQAIDAAQEGDEIIVSEGIYVENIKFNGTNIILHSTEPTNPTVVENTIIDGNQLDSVVTFWGQENEICIISGFTITNGKATYYGGGIKSTYSSYPTIKNNIIKNNSAEDNGGGIYNCDGAILNNIIKDNSSDYGGGIYDCDGLIQNNLIIFNTVNVRGGGISSSDGQIQNNTIFGNNAQDLCGGVYSCVGQILNCIVWGNTDSEENKQVISSNILSYCCIQNWTDGGIGNISIDPQFIDISKNFRLPPSSPCINSGYTYLFSMDYNTDLDGNSRIVGNIVDMGCYEFNSSKDSDGDLLSDIDENAQGSDLNNRDSDGDGLIDGIEVIRGTSPTIANTPPGISIPSQFSTIQQGIFLAFSGEQITVAPGTYFENLWMLGKNVILQSEDPLNESIVDSTILDGSDTSSVITFKGSENETCIIKGFTIRNGSSGSGAGLKCNNSTVTIENNKITNNNGPAIYKCNGLIQNNKISNNSGSSGSALYYCNGTIQNNVITQNTYSSSDYHYGGLYYCNGTIKQNIISYNSRIGLYYCNGDIIENTISDNLGDGLHYCDGLIQGNIIQNNLGDGLYGCDGTVFRNTILHNAESGLSQCSGKILNNIIKDNKGIGVSGCSAVILNNFIIDNVCFGKGGGLSGCSGIIVNNTIAGNVADECGGVYNSNAFFCNNIVWGNFSNVGKQIEDSGPFIYSCLEEWDGVGQGNISLDPGFVDPDNSNYHLREGSFCINRGNKYYLLGDTVTDIDNECRISGNTVDIGCDEFGSSLDSDGDFLTDVNELIYGTDINNPDTDGDGLKDGLELSRSKNPLIFDEPIGIPIPQQYPLIQMGIFLAFTNEEIILSTGTYAENVNFLGKNVTLRSLNPDDENTVNATIIDGGNFYATVSFTGSEDKNSFIKGLTIRNGTIGINCFSATPIIQQCKIINNSSYGIYKCRGLIENNIISDNKYYGTYYCDKEIRNNIISNNQTGGICGVYYFSYYDNIIENNTITGNSGSGILYVYGTIRNNTITNNHTTREGGGLYGCFGIIEGNTISNNIADDNGGALSNCGRTIQNNIITNNYAGEDGGAFYYCTRTIQNNIISNNVAQGNGGGFAECGYYYWGIYNYETVIQNNSVFNNVAYGKGGGFYHCKETIQNNKIYSNSANFGGGFADIGIGRDEPPYPYNPPTIRVQNNLIYNNYAETDGGGIYESYALIYNNTLYGNSAGSLGGGMAKGYGIVKNCIFWENTALLSPQILILNDPNLTLDLSYCCIQDWTGVWEGIITGNPQFVDAENGDFHLLPGSPCIDAGGLVEGLVTDFEGNPRPYNSTPEPRGDGSDYDIGADEFIGLVTEVINWMYWF